MSKQDLKCIKLYFLFGESGYPVTDELFYVDSPVHQVVDAVTDQTSLVSNYPESIEQISLLFLFVHAFPREIFLDSKSNNPIPWTTISIRHDPRVGVASHVLRT